jgi:DNA-binding response OmpR family regulator
VPLGILLARGRANMPSPENENSSLRGLRILMVDPDGPSAKLINAILEDEGCELRVATNAKEALIAVMNFRPGLILLELVLADLPGLELVRLLKSEPSMVATTIVAVTASNGPETRRLALEAGCAEYMRKPIDALAFTARLKTILGKPFASSNAKRGIEG